MVTYYLRQRDDQRTQRLKIAVAVMITVLALYLRLYHSQAYPGYVDVDERIYVPIAQAYASAIQRHDLQAIINYPDQTGHTSLAKLIFALPLAMNAPQPFIVALWICRLISIIFAGASTFLIAMLNPAAGLFFAVHTLIIKYTSEAYLDSIAYFFVVLGIYALQHWIKQPQRSSSLLMAYMSLGAAIASKEMMLLPFLAIMPFLLTHQEKRKVIFMLPVVGITFVVFNPWLWNNGLARLVQTLYFHQNYAQGKFFRVYIPEPSWQIYEWALKGWDVGVMRGWDRQLWSMFRFSIDWFIIAVGILGVPFLIRFKQFMYLLWLIVAAVTLWVWPIKWAQYSLLLLLPLTVSGGYFITWYLQLLTTEIQGWFSTGVKLRPDVVTASRNKTIKT